MKEEARVAILKEATSQLLQLGFLARQRGYRYLREAILVVCQEPDTITSVTKLLYPEVARRFNTTDKQVERAIRNSIETAWIKGNQDALHEMFGESYTQGDLRPTNSEVIETLANYVDKEISA